jgi:hypothetical protein
VLSLPDAQAFEHCVLSIPLLIAGILILYVVFCVQGLAAGPELIAMLANAMRLSIRHHMEFKFDHLSLSLEQVLPPFALLVASESPSTPQAYKLLIMRSKTWNHMSFNVLWWATPCLDSFAAVCLCRLQNWSHHEVHSAVQFDEGPNGIKNSHAVPAGLKTSVTQPPSTLA